MQFAKNVFRLSVLAGLCAFSCGANAVLTDGEMIIVHPFQWTYDNIAKECKEVLGPKGYDGIQISQPAEHLDKRSEGNPWWAVYQPVNFENFSTMTGNETQLRNMIKACNEAGVKVFADAVFNQRAYGSGSGYGGSQFSNRNFPDLKYEDFHDEHCQGINYGVLREIQFCDLSGMPDLKTESDSTRTKIANYLKNLMSMGVYGFRIDAAKHMPAQDLEAILAKAGNPPVYMEVIGADGQPVQPTDYAYIPNSVVTEFKYCGAMLGNIYNPAPLINLDDTWTQLPGYASEVFVTNHDSERNSAGTKYLTYQDNGWAFQLAQSFMVAYPFGTVRQIYSGYQFSDHDQGGPISATPCSGGWHCEHRESIVNNAVGFARATRGLGASNKGAEGKVIWFSRGTKGFYALNAGDNDVTKSFPVSVPDGQYCEILQQDDKCGGQQVTVSGGKATITVKAHKAAAICVDDSGNGFCGGESVDICEKDPTSTACICKNNPDAAVCVGDRYYAGTSNSWTFTKMTYNEGAKAWTIPLDLDGKGDADGVQRFKITDQPDWKGTIWGSKGGNVLCSDGDLLCPDVEIDGLTGQYTLYVDRNNSYRLEQGEVPPAPLVASFTASVNGSRVTFTNTTFSNDDDAAGATYKWYFGDGKTSSKANPSYTYAAAGTYRVTLKVKKDGQLVSTKQKVKVKGPCQPKYSELYFAGTATEWVAKPFTFNRDTCQWEIKAVKFTGKSDAGGKQRFRIYDSEDLQGMSWGQGSGNLLSPKATSKDVFVQEIGYYGVAVNDSDKYMSYALSPYPKGNHYPIASFTAEVNGSEVTLTSTSRDDDNDPLTVTWSFGDGAKGTGSVVTHKYDAEGTYKIKMRVSDGKANSETVAKKVKVEYGAFEKIHDALYFVGTPNSWQKFDAMTFDGTTGKWSIDLALTGEGDASGSQRFKITDQQSWTGSVWGDAGGNALCDDESSCKDVHIDQVGNYTLYIDDASMTWSLVKKDGPEEAVHDQLYFAGSTNGWSFTPMTYDGNTGSWYIDLQLTGEGDADGAQRFKITEQAAWSGGIWGTTGGNALCSNEATCKDVYITQKGNYRLSVDDRNMTWSLTAN